MPQREAELCNASSTKRADVSDELLLQGLEDRPETSRLHLDSCQHRERVAAFATTKLLEFRRSLEITSETFTQGSRLLRQAKGISLEAIFAWLQKREITVTHKGPDIKVAVFGLEDKVRVRWASWVRTNAKDLPELPCEEDLFPAQSGGLKMHDGICKLVCAGHPPHSHHEDVGHALGVGQRCDSRPGGGLLVARRRGRSSTFARRCWTGLPDRVT